MINLCEDGYDEPVALPELPKVAPKFCEYCGAKLGNPSLDFEHKRGHCDPKKFHVYSHLTGACNDGRHINCNGMTAFRWNNQTLGTSGAQYCPCTCHGDEAPQQLYKLRKAWEAEQR